MLISFFLSTIIDNDVISMPYRKKYIEHILEIKDDKNIMQGDIENDSYREL